MRIFNFDKLKILWYILKIIFAYLGYSLLVPLNNSNVIEDIEFNVSEYRGLSSVNLTTLKPLLIKLWIIAPLLISTFTLTVILIVHYRRDPASIRGFIDKLICGLPFAFFALIGIDFVSGYFCPKNLTTLMIEMLLITAITYIHLFFYPLIIIEAKIKECKI